MGTVLTEGRHSNDFILAEADFRHCRDEVTIAADQVLEPGTVLELDGDEYVMLASGDPVAVLVEPIDTTDGAKASAVLVRGPCQLIGGMLVFTSGTSDNDKETAFAALGALGIVVRPSADSY